MDATLRLALLFSLFFLSLYSQESVTYGLSGGRFGDNLISYLHAKWISHEKKIPIVYKPFPLSDELKIDEGEVPKGEIHVCPYFPESSKEIHANPRLFDVDWENELFREDVLKRIAPKRDLQLIHPPSNTINIAIHIREGGGYDDEATKKQFPLKLPPFDYYKRGLLQVISLFPGKSFYCYVFTDARRPKNLIADFLKEIPQGTLIFFEGRERSYPNENVLEDFFSLFHFDILIRPESNFSIVPCLLHDYAIVCSPDYDADLQEIAVEMKIRKQSFEQLLRRECTRWPKFSFWLERFLRKWKI